MAFQESKRQGRVTENYADPPRGFRQNTADFFRRMFDRAKGANISAPYG